MREALTFILNIFLILTELQVSLCSLLEISPLLIIYLHDLFSAWDIPVILVLFHSLVNEISLAQNFITLKAFYAQVFCWPLVLTLIKYFEVTCLASI